MSLTYPLIVVSELLTRLIARGQNGHAFSRDEFVAMADVGPDGRGHHDAAHERRQHIREADARLEHGMPRH